MTPTVSPLPFFRATPPLGYVMAGMAMLWLGTGPVSASDGWMDRRGGTVDQAAVLERLERADIILLGEVHDSQEIHETQVELLEALGDGPLVLALEQLDLEHHARLVAADRRKHADGRLLAESGRFDADGWGWEHYDDLFSLAAERGWPVRPINLSRESAREFAREGDGWRLVLDDEQVEVIETLAPDLSLPDSLHDALVSDLIEVHCGDLDAGFAERIVRAQVARDILMADAILAARDEFPERPVVAVMGNQHARLDRGVGYWIGQILSERSDADHPVLISVGMLPVDEAQADEVKGSSSDQHHLRLLTPPVDRPPHCDPDNGSSSSRGWAPERTDTG